MAAAACPGRESDVADAIADALRAGEALAITGGGSKRDIGAPVPARPLDMRALSGVVDYDPAELVLTVRPGTPLAEVEALVAGERQMLAFEPFDHAPLFGRAVGAATIGGVVAAGVAGARRLTMGAPRDHLLGFRAVSGRGEPFVAGAKVVKNVTGYDLPKLAAGSWGRLFALTELTLKVLPRPRTAATRIVRGLGSGQAVRVMAAALGSQAEVGAASHIPRHATGEPAVTAFRIEGFEPSVAARCAMLSQRLDGMVRLDMPDEAEAASIWRDMETLAPLGIDAPLWRISVPPRATAGVIAALRPLGARWMLDWAGGLVWLALHDHAPAIRDAARTAGGHATLIRADAAVRSMVPAFHPPATGIAALEERVRRAFDPAGVFETGRF